MIEAAISGGSSLAGGVISNIWTDKRQEDAQKFNAQQAQDNREFQEKMSNSAYQRAMYDMKAAGLNPMLAYQKGPASSPTGAMASTSYTPATDVISPAVSSAMQATRLKQELQNMQETNTNLQAQNKLISAQAIQTNASTAKTVAETAVVGEMLKEAERKGALGEIDRKFYESTIGTILRNLGLAVGEIGRATGPMRDIADTVSRKPRIVINKNYGD